MAIVTSKATRKVTCHHCDKRFAARRVTARYCSPTCRVSAHRKAVTLSHSHHPDERKVSNPIMESPKRAL
jgi:hypothetical protein